MNATLRKMLFGVMGLASGSMLLITAADARPGPEMAPPTFQELDANSDGAITTAEFNAFRLAKFSAADTDGDGALSIDEMKAQIDSNRTARMEKAVQRMDANGDGVLSPDELAARAPKRVLDWIDRDGDGSVSEQEYASMVARFERGGPFGRKAHGKNPMRHCVAPADESGADDGQPPMRCK